MAIPWVQHASTNGDGTGTVNATGDYSGGSATDFTVECQAGTRRMIVHRMVYYSQDTGTIDAGGWGAGSALSNGVSITVHDENDNEVIDLTPTALTINAHWGLYAYDVNPLSFGTGDNMVVARWSFDKFTPSGIVLKPGDYVKVALADSMTALVAQYFTFQGNYG